MHSPGPATIPVETLLMAYRHGVFPMSDGRDDPEVFWVEPRQRAIIPLATFRPSRSLLKLLGQDRFRVTLDADFEGVIAACAAPRPDHPESWISQRIAASYRQLHASGHAHSIECWDDDGLAGGLYGVSFDRVFCGESMFTRRSNASKVALAWLVALMRRTGYQLLDCQFMTQHLMSLGAVEIPQAEYLRLLSASRGEPGEPLSAAFAYYSCGAGAGGACGGTASSPGKLIAQSFTQTS